MTEEREDKTIEALELFAQAMENAVQVLKHELSHIRKAPGSVQSSGLTEESFNILKWEPGKGSKLGEFQVAYKSSNLPDKYGHAFNILRANNATLNNHFGPEGFNYYYWLYLEKYNDRIFRKKREAST